MPFASVAVSVVARTAAPFVALVFALVVAPVAAFAFQPAGDLPMRSAAYAWAADGDRQVVWTLETHAAPLTVRTRLAVEEAGYTSLSAVVLSSWIVVSGTGTESSPEPLMELIWEKDAGAWIPSWQVKLRYRSPGSAGAGLASELVLARAVPVRGHVYEAVVSYHPDSGSVAAALADLTAGSTLFRGVAAVAGGAGNVRLGAGFRTTAGIPAPGEGAFAGAIPVSVSAFEVTPFYLPVGAGWEVGIREQGLGRPVPVWRFEPGDDVVVVLTLDHPGPVAAAPAPAGGDARGTFRLVYTRAGEERLLYELSGAARGERVIPVPASELPLGPGALRLDYVQGGRVLLSGAKEISIGHIDVRIGELERVGGELRGTARVAAGSAYGPIPISLNALLAVRKWNAELRRWEVVPGSTQTAFSGIVDISGDREVEIPLAVALPEEPGAWEVGFAAEAPVPASVRTLGKRRLFAVAAAPGGPATSVRICTYNVLGFQGWPEAAAAGELGARGTARHLDYFAGVLGELGCDVLGVQEGWSFAFLDRLAAAMGAHVAKFATPTSFPGAIFTRFPILEQRDFTVRLPSGDVPFSRSAGAALLDVRGTPVWVVTIHAHPTREELRRMEANVLAQRVDELLAVSENVIVLGDFNSQPGGVIHQVLVERGFLNAMDLAGGGVEPTMTTLQGAGTITIDHIYVSPALAGSVRSSRVVSDPGFRMGAGASRTWVNSDHLPVTADLEWH